MRDRDAESDDRLFPDFAPGAVITSLTPTARDPSRTSIHVNRRFVTALPGSVVAELSLSVGGAWTGDLAERVAALAVRDKVWRDVMNRLTRRSMSRRQLRDKLRRKDHPEAAIDAALDRAEQLGFLNDEAFARAFLNDMQRAKPAGPALMRAKLMQRGIDGGLIDRLIDELSPEHDEAIAQAASLAERKLASLERYDMPTRKRRLWGLLSRRGFRGDVVREAIDRVLRDSDEE